MYSARTGVPPPVPSPPPSSCPSAHAPSTFSSHATHSLTLYPWPPSPRAPPVPHAHGVSLTAVVPFACHPAQSILVTHGARIKHDKPHKLALEASGPLPLTLLAFIALGRRGVGQ